MSDPVAPLLMHYGSIVHGAMLEFLPSTQPGSDTQSYLYGPLGEYPRRKGKMIRGSLCIAAARLYDGAVKDVLNTAVALELLHSATLVHDDLEDGAQTRRRGPALHAKYGSGLAINAGDALFLLALRPLLKNFEVLEVSVATKLLTEFDWAAWQTVEGQAMELGWRRFNRLDVSVAHYFTMAMKKTAWLGMILPLRAGALIATGGKCEPNDVVELGYYLGCLFQIANDIANLVDPQNCVDYSFLDLFEGKRSLILVHLISKTSLRDKGEVDRILRKPRSEVTPDEIKRLYDLILKYRSIEFARSAAETMAEAATIAFTQTFDRRAPSPDKDFILGLIEYFSSLAEAH
ncbi:polyprenyl synthetase family protein [Bradyrhizobium manausense]|uniref:polyprenyl synthetase family protein n=1 Tax=Bradyrhizobium manausense TaxID=989370 RepID=UPI001BA88F4A|nr:polyprenyl synthetase family protein [Bradyrhizobium manausense]MBR0829840.1 polyprenyl synthetase family protein [Bradyrhizobium manausense]